MSQKRINNRRNWSLNGIKLGNTEITHLEGSSFEFQSHQYVWDWYFQNPWLFSQEGSCLWNKFWELSGQRSSGIINIFLFSRSPLSATLQRQSLKLFWQCFYYFPVGSSHGSAPHCFALIPVYIFGVIQYETKQLWCLQALYGNLLQMVPVGKLLRL